MNTSDPEVLEQQLKTTIAALMTQGYFDIQGIMYLTCDAVKEAIETDPEWRDDPKWLEFALNDLETLKSLIVDNVTT